MIFEYFKEIFSAMKKFIYIILTLLIVTSCSVSNEARTTRIEQKQEKNLADREMIRKAVESQRFIVRFDRLFFRNGGMIDLVPRANFIIVDGERSVISTAYLGRQYSFRPIAGITLRGKTVEYALKDKSSKGRYEIDLKVDNEGDTFDIYLSIGEDGYLQASISSLQIDNVRYSGHIIPIKEKRETTDEGSVII